MRQDKNIIILGIVFALLFFFLGKGRLFTEDMVIHLAFIKKIQSPWFYPGDYLFQFTNPQKQYTFYYPFLAYLGRGYELPTLFRKVYFVSAVLFCIGALRLIGNNRHGLFAGIVFLSLLTFRFQVGGSAISIMETEPLPRFLSLVPLVWSIVFLQKRRYWLSFILILAGFFIHPLTVIYYILCLAGYFLYSNHNKLTLRLKILGIVVLTIGIISSLLLPSMQSDWLAIVRMRNPYAFLSLWSFRSWLNLGLLCAPGLASWYFYRTKSIWQKLFNATFLMSVVVSIAHYIFTDINPVNHIIALQLGRIWIFAVWISLLIFSMTLAKLIRKTWQRGLLIGVIILLVALNSMRLISYVPRDAALETAAIWANTHTASNCTFLVPFYSKGFRVLSERPIVGEYKDGALVFYSRDFAFLWKKRLEDLGDWENFLEPELLNLQNKYGFNYVVTQKLLTDWPLIYSSTPYMIYAIQSTPRCKVI